MAITASNIECDNGRFEVLTGTPHTGRAFADVANVKRNRVYEGIDDVLKFLDGITWVLAPAGRHNALWFAVIARRNKLEGVLLNLVQIFQCAGQTFAVSNSL